VTPAPYGRERALRFGVSASLVGVLTEAIPTDADSERPAILFLNSGILHRVGSCRLHVRLARELSAQGFHCLRFDYSGIGDSDPRRDALPFEESAVIETREAMDHLAKLKGVRTFVLMGLCSGADIAHATAVVDPRVVGLNMIDAWAYRTPGYYVHHYGPKVLDWRAWWNAVRVRVALLTQKARARPGIPSGDGVEYELPTYTRIFPPKAQVANELKTLVARRVRLRALWTGGLPEYNHRGQYAAGFPTVDFGSCLDEDHLPAADHILTGLDHQEYVTSRTREWVATNWLDHHAATPSVSLVGST